jgi:hypothetical protein
LRNHRMIEEEPKLGNSRQESLKWFFTTSSQWSKAKLSRQSFSYVRATPEDFHGRFSTNCKFQTRITCGP